MKHVSIKNIISLGIVGSLTFSVLGCSSLPEIISTIKDLSDSKSTETSKESSEKEVSKEDLVGKNGQLGFDFSDGKGGIKESGSDNFNQFIPKDDRAVIGTIPAGVSNLSVELKAENDLDVELWSGDTFVVGWEKDSSGSGGAALISSTTTITDTYKGDSITWSGWDGDGTGAGNEFIKISGTTKNKYEMRAFGYEAGNAKVNYNWGK